MCLLKAVWSTAGLFVYPCQMLVHCPPTLQTAPYLSNVVSHPVLMHKGTKQCCKHTSLWHHLFHFRRASAFCAVPYLLQAPLVSEGSVASSVGSSGTVPSDDGGVASWSSSPQGSRRSSLANSLSYSAAEVSSVERPGGGGGRFAGGGAAAAARVLKGATMSSGQPSALGCH
jgi:hypothetical protein